MSVTETTQVVVSEHVHAREFDGEVVIVDLSGGDYFGLDDIGSRMWSELVKGRTPREVAALLKDEYEVDEAALVRDVVRLVQQLLDHGLITVR